MTAWILPRLAFRHYVSRSLEKANNNNFLARQLYEKCRDQFDNFDQAYREVCWISESLESHDQGLEKFDKASRLEMTVMDLRINKRLPLAYIIGTQPFGNLPHELIVRPPILIPRQETADWVNILIDKLNEKFNIPLSLLDLGSGSGCISFLLAHNLKVITTGVDISLEAVELALENAQLLKLKNCTFINTDMFNTNIIKGGEVDIIVSNPPYISREEYDGLDPEVKNWEAKNALLGNLPIKDGLEYYRKIISTWAGRVRVGLFMEVGIHQAKMVQDIAKKGSLWNSIEIWKDLKGIDRCIACWK